MQIATTYARHRRSCFSVSPTCTSVSLAVSKLLTACPSTTRLSSLLFCSTSRAGSCDVLDTEVSFDLDVMSLFESCINGGYFNPLQVVSLQAMKVQISRRLILELLVLLSSGRLRTRTSNLCNAIQIIVSATMPLTEIKVAKLKVRFSSVG